jgi:hypothetical protein
MYLPDGTSTLHKIVVGQSGSGKSYYLEATSKAFLKRNRNPNFRMLYFSPKNEGYLDLLGKKQKPVSTIDGMLKSMNEEYLTVFYPPAEGLESLMDEVIDSLFSLRDSNDDLKITVIIDDAQVFLSSRKPASDSQRRLALLGRSRSINAIYVSHAVIMNKALEAQIEMLTFFTMPNPIHYKDSILRYGFDPEPYSQKLKDVEFSFVIFDIKTGTATLMSPIGDDE